MTFPVPPRPDAERRACESLRERAAALGPRGARPFGHTARAPGHVADATLAALGAAALAAVAAGLDAAAWALALAVLGAGLRAADLPSVERLLPRRPAWSTVLRALGPDTVRVHVAVLDRETVWPLLPRVTLGALLAGGVALGLGPTASASAAVVLVGVAAFAALATRTVPAAADAPEAAAVDAVLAALAADPAAAGLLCGAASRDGHGVAAALDWHAVRRDRAEILLHGAPASVERAARALERARWRARAAPAEPRSPP